MPCYHPLPGWKARKRNESGKRSIVFNLNDGYLDMPVTVPCGRCIGCRLEKARQWALRCVHEAKLWDDNCFVTLTYRDVPPGGSLRPRDFVLFMKRLRKEFGPGIRFFQCGEYGDDLGRPHHHAALFNCHFPDRRHYRTTPAGDRLDSSARLERLWGHGLCAVGSLTFESAGYVARYQLKKVTGPGAEAHYNGKVPEYLTMSRRPGIGRGWAERYLGDYYPSDEVVVRGFPSKPPRYYDNILAAKDPVMYRRIVRLRKEAAEADPEAGKRLGVKEQVTQAAIRQLTRDLEGNP